MLSILASDDTCVEAMSLLITNIINGDIPNQVRHLFTSSRLVALGKKNGGVRPVAIGEYFYRIAAAHAFRVVREYMAELLSPHQYGIGISNGCEKIIHNISHSLFFLINTIYKILQKIYILVQYDIVVMHY